MSYPPPPPGGFAPPPPSHLTGFTVDSGFSVTPPKRPAVVTAAAWMLFVLAGLALLGLVAAVSDLLHGHWFNDSGPLILVRVLFQPLFMLALAIAAVVIGLSVRQGRDGARIAGYVAVGGAAFTGLVSIPRGFGYMPQIGEGLIWALSGLVVAISGVVTLVLLAHPATDEWFDLRRRARFLNPATDTHTVPSELTRATILLAAIAALAVIELAMTAVWRLGGDASYPGANTTALLVADVARPLLILIAGALSAALVRTGRDGGRVVAFGLCGMLLDGVVNVVITLVSLISVGVDALDGFLLLGLALTPVQAALGIGVILTLGRGAVGAWFHQERRARAGHTAVG